MDLGRVVDDHIRVGRVPRRHPGPVERLHDQGVAGPKDPVGQLAVLFARKWPVPVDAQSRRGRAGCDELPKALVVHARRPNGRELGRARAGTRTHRRPAPWIGEQRADGVSHERRVEPAQHDAGLTVEHDVTDAAQREGDDGTAGHLRLDDHARDPFGVAGEDRDLDARIDELDVLALAEQRDVAAEVPHRDLLLEPSAQWTVAGDDEMRALAVLQHRLEHIERSKRLLLLDEVADESDQMDVVVEHADLRAQTSRRGLAVDVDEAIRSPVVGDVPERTEVSETAQLDAQVGGQGDGRVHPVRDELPPAPLDRVPHPGWEPEDALPDEERTAASRQRHRGDLRGRATVQQQDIGRFAGERPAQEPGQVRDMVATDLAHPRERFDRGVPPAVEPGGQGEHAIRVPECVELVSELQRDHLRPPPLAAADEMHDPHIGHRVTIGARESLGTALRRRSNPRAPRTRRPRCGSSSTAWRGCSRRGPTPSSAR